MPHGDQIEQDHLPAGDFSAWLAGMRRALRDEMAGVDQAIRLYRHIPRAELAVIPNADHGAAEQPLFWQVIRKFLARHTDAALAVDGMPA